MLQLCSSVAAVLLLLVGLSSSGKVNLLYTSDVSGHLFEVDGDGRTCTRFWTNGSLIQNEPQYAPLHACSGGAAGRSHFIDKYYDTNGGHENVLLLDTGNHFYGSREYFHSKASGIADISKNLLYDVMVLSSKDLHAEQEELKEFIDAMTVNGVSVPFVASNLIQNMDAPTKVGKLYELMNTKIKQWVVVETCDTNSVCERIVIFSLLPKDAVLRSRCGRTSDRNGAVHVLGQDAPSEEWLMSQVSHLNRLWEEVKEEQKKDNLLPITYSILVADLPMEQVVVLTRVLSFINVGIGSSVPTKKLGGTCDPKTMTLTSCAPLNGQPQIVSVEKGVERDLKGMAGFKGTGFFLSHVSAPVDVQTYFNATYVATTNGRGVGVFEHDVDQVTNLGRNPFGHLYVVNNQDLITPSSLLRTTGIQQSWLDRPDASVITIIETIAQKIGEQQTKLLKSNPQGNVSQPVYGDSFGTQIYRKNRFRQVGCRQADCPLGRLFLDAMLGAAWGVGLCDEGKQINGGSSGSGRWCIALVDGNAFATSLSGYGQSWRDGTNVWDQMVRVSWILELLFFEW